MRAFIPAFEAKTPTSLADALNLLSTQRSHWRPLAGGTDLMVLIESGTLESGHFLNLQHLEELKGITANADNLTIGALTSFGALKHHEILQKEFPLLAEASRLIGATAIQNRATIGGNIANASPAADSPPALLVYDAKIELVSTRGVRLLAYADFHKGYKQTALESDELIQRILLPRAWDGTWVGQYRKIGARNAQAISKICFAARAKLLNPSPDSHVILSALRLALGSVAPTVLRARNTEAFLLNRPLDRKTIIEAKRLLAEEISPIDDVRSNKAYRLQVSLNLLEDFLLSLKRRS